MDRFSRVDRSVIKKAKIKDCTNDFAYWQAQSFEFRLEALETIREEYNRWKYGSEQGFQRVYTIIKRP